MIFCLHNRNHSGFYRDYEAYELPDDFTLVEFGQMVYNRLFLYNEFDPTRNVVFSENLQKAPNVGQAFRGVGSGWTPIDINDTNLEFGRWCKGYLSILILST